MSTARAAKPKTKIVKPPKSIRLSTLTSTVLFETHFAHRPPNTNNAYRSSRYGVRLTKQAKAFKENLKAMIRQCDLWLPALVVLAMDVTYWCPVGGEYEEAQINVFDVDGSHKLLQDCFYEVAKEVFEKEAAELGELDNAEFMKRNSPNDKWEWDFAAHKRLVTSSQCPPRLRKLYPKGFTTVVIRTMADHEYL